MPDPLPLRFLLVLFAGWIHREQTQVVDYLVEENRVLREHLGDRRLRLTDDQRRRLAAMGKALGRSLLARVATIVSTDTIRRRYHALMQPPSAPCLNRTARDTATRRSAGRATAARNHEKGQTAGHCADTSVPCAATFRRSTTRAPRSP